MDRHEFSMLVCDLLQVMEKMGYKPFIDYVKRSDEEQKSMYLRGLSKCDGIIRVSQHQRGRAVDIYFEDQKGLTDTEIRNRHQMAHDIWVGWGGRGMLDWDEGHYEVGA